VIGGVVDGNEVLGYYKNKITPADPELEKPALIDACEHKLLWPIEGQYMVLPGDSGSVVLARGEEGLDFVGTIVSLWVEGDGIVGEDDLVKTLGLIVPASTLFRQMERPTGVKWAVC
jgi:hypothetical protein